MLRLSEIFKDLLVRNHSLWMCYIVWMILRWFSARFVFLIPIHFCLSYFQHFEFFCLSCLSLNIYFSKDMPDRCLDWRDQTNCIGKFFFFSFSFFLLIHGFWEFGVVSYEWKLFVSSCIAGKACKCEYLGWVVVCVWKTVNEILVRDTGTWVQDICFVQFYQ